MRAGVIIVKDGEGEGEVHGTDRGNPNVDPGLTGPACDPGGKVTACVHGGGLRAGPVWIENGQAVDAAGKSGAHGLPLRAVPGGDVGHARGARSEEHTSELQSRGLISYAAFC